MSDEAPGAAAETAASALPWRTLRFLLGGKFATQAAAQLQAVAVGWYIYALTDSAFDLGLIGLVQFLPTAGLSLLAGHVLDRYPRRTVLLSALGLELLCSAALAAMALLGIARAGPVFLVIFFFGAGRAFDNPTWPALIAALVPGQGMRRAITFNSLATQAAIVLGPTASGIIIALFSPGAAFAAAAVLLAVALGAVWRQAPPARRSAGEPLSWRSLMGGITFIRQHEAVQGAIALDLFAVLFGGATALLPIFARDVLMIGPWGFGILRAAPAVGGIAMGTFLARHPPQRRVGRRMLLAVAVFGAATIVFGLSRNPALSFIALIVVGAADMMSVVIRMTLLQTAAPDAIRGRVNAVNSIFTGASNLLGEFESGTTAAWFGPIASVVLGGTATLAIAALWLKRFPALRRMDRFAIAEE